MTTPDEVSARLDTHEAVCAERYKALDSKVEDVKDSIHELRGLLLKVAAAIGLGMVSMIGYLLVRYVLVH